MSAPSGWYPDPGGQPGSYRYWDGQQWSQQLTRDPAAAPPGGSRKDTLELGSPRRGDGRTWLVGLIAAVLVAAVVVVLVVRNQLDDGGLEIGDQRPDGTSTRELCILPEETPSSPPQAGDRVVSGALSYPRIGAPFGPVTGDDRVPFGRDIRSQSALVETRADGTLSWVAQIVIAQLVTGDGFYEPQQGARILADCIAGLFFADVGVEREGRRDEAITIDGHRGWLVEAHLTFDVAGIDTKGETIIVIVVETPQGAGLFYGSLPDSSPDYNEMIRQAMRDLRIE